MKTKAVLGKVLLSSALLWALSAPVAAAPLFTIEIEVDEDGTPGGAAETRTFSFDNIEAAIEELDEAELVAAFGAAYNPDMSTVEAMLDYRGVDVILTIDESAMELTIEVPAANIDHTFSGENASEELKEYLKTEGGDDLNRLQAALIAESPVDPVAGNPSSLASTTVAEQFSEGFSDEATQIVQEGAVDTGRTAEGEARNPDNLFLFGLQAGRYKAGDRTANVFVLPLGYSFRLQEEGKGLQKINFTLPIAYAEIEGGETLSASLGLGATFGVNDRWSLSPAFGVGVTGSADLGAGGGIGSVSLTSAYTIPIDKYSLSIGNMIAYYETLDLKIKDYSFNPGVSNTVFRNGLLLSIPGKMGQRKVATELWATDTRFDGDTLYSEFQQEYGVSFGSAKTDEFSIKNYLRVGASYLTGDKDIEGLKLNFGYKF